MSTVSNRKLPATIKPRNVLAPFRTLAEIADELVERYQEIDRHSRALMWWSDGATTSELPAESELTVDDYDRQRIARAQALLERLDPAEACEPWREDDEDGEDEGGGGLKREVIGERLAVMLGAFPGGGQPSAPENFLQMLLEHVAAARVSLVALHTGCVELESKRATLPAISTVLATLREHEGTWRTRRRAIEGLSQLAARAVKDLKLVRAKVEAHRAKEAVREMRSGLDIARYFLARKQTESAKLAQDIAEGFEGLLYWEAQVENAERDLATLPRGPDGDGDD